jgi:hypothetical protein
MSKGQSMNTEYPPEKIRKPAHRLFDFLIKNYRLKNDHALSLALDVVPSAVCKIRAGRPVTAAIILKIHEKYDIPIRDIKGLL